MSGMMPPPVTKRCLTCGHQAHPGRECGWPTTFTHTCTCPRVYDPAKDRRDHDDLADARFYHGDYPPRDELNRAIPDSERTAYDPAAPDFDERKATREHDAEWYPDDRD